MRGVEEGGCLKMVWDRGDRCLFVFLCCRRLFFNVFSFSVCKAQLIDNWGKNRQGAPKCLVRFFNKFFWSANRQYELVTWYTVYLEYYSVWPALPNCLKGYWCAKLLCFVRLACFYPNWLLTGLYKQKTKMG
jgi:hypothetical protein